MFCHASDEWLYELAGVRRVESYAAGPLPAEPIVLFVDVIPRRGPTVGCAWVEVKPTQRPDDFRRGVPFVGAGRALKGGVHVGEIYYICNLKCD